MSMIPVRPTTRALLQRFGARNGSNTLGTPPAQWLHLCSGHGAKPWHLIFHAVKLLTWCRLWANCCPPRQCVGMATLLCVGR